MVGSKKYKKHKSQVQRLFDEEMKMGVNFRSRFLNKTIRNKEDISNGNAYRKLPRGAKYSWTLT
jgi:hypothetical protein